MVNNCNVHVLYKSIFSKKVYIFWTRIFFLYLAWTANIRLGGTVWLAARTLKTKSGFFVFQLDAQETVRLKKDFFEKKIFFCVSDASPRLNFFLRSLSRGANVIKTFLCLWFTNVRNYQVFVTGKPFPKNATVSGRLLALPTNIRLTWRGMPGTNPLA
jgi:hypothetical protein